MESWAYGCTMPLVLGAGYLISAWRLFPRFFWQGGHWHFVVWWCLSWAGLLTFAWHDGPLAATSQHSFALIFYLRASQQLVAQLLIGLPFLVRILVRYHQQNKEVRHHWQAVALDAIAAPNDDPDYDAPATTMPADDVRG